MAGLLEHGEPLVHPLGGVSTHIPEGLADELAKAGGRHGKGTSGQKSIGPIFCHLPSARVA